MTHHLHYLPHDVLVSSDSTGNPADPARFNWPASIKEVNQPRLTALPKILPIPLGLALPDSPTWTNLLALAPSFPILGAWINAIQYLQNHHGATPFNVHNVHLEWNTVNATAFNGLALATTLPLALTWFTPEEVGHREVRNRAKAVQNMAYLKVAEGEPAPVPAGPGPTPGQGAPPAFLTKISENMVTISNTLSTMGINSLLTKTDRDNATEVSDNINKFKLLLSRVEPVTDATTGITTNKVILPELSDPVLRLLKEPKITRATIGFQESFASHLAKLHKSEN
jgi:hypothetical protein